MLSKSFVALSLLSSSVSAETVLGVYMFHRHGDRTPKALAPANLTDLGYTQVYTSGDYYRSRYIDSAADHKILGINSDIVKQSQISASAPSDTGMFAYLRGEGCIRADFLTFFLQFSRTRLLVSCRVFILLLARLWVLRLSAMDLT